MAEQIILIKAQQTRKYGIVEQTYSVEMTISVTGSKDRQQAFDNINKVVAQEFAAFEQNYLPKSQEDDHKTGDTRWQNGTLKKVVEGDAVRYKLHTGIWQKWGVPVYPEVISQFPEFPEGVMELDLQGKTGLIQVIDGKPKKVLSCQ